MMETIKRYSLAFGILFFVILLMFLGTFAVKSFGDNMLENSHETMKPRGEHIDI